MFVLLRFALGALLVAIASLGVHAQTSSASISTDKALYQAGETITICYSVPRAGPVNATDFSSDGSSAVLLSVYDDGSGWCFPAIAQGPASTERLVLNWGDGSQSGSAESVYQVVTTSTTHVLTLADSGTTVTVSIGDTIEARLGTELNWQLSLSDSTVLQAAPGLPPDGVQGAWVASAAGQTTILGRGDPLCYPRCLAPSRLFTVNIVVTS